ncbi:cytochrome c biogenesis CcdA family protein [Jatrophihabitans sp. YIM 134969]
MTSAAADFGGVVQDGPLLLAVGVSVLVGIVGFLSPCVLPLVPGYLSYVTSLSGENRPQTTTTSGGTAVLTETRVPLRRMAAGAGLFVLGFTVVFVALGALFGQLGSLILEHQLMLQRIAGVITIVLGLVFLGAFRPLQRELKIHRLPRAGLLGAPLLGATFGLGWTPCLTPTLTVVVSLSVSESSAGRGAILAAAYCIGLGVPFLLIALGVGWAAGAVAFLRRHVGVVSRIGGGLLVVIGVLLVTGAWDSMVRWLQGEFGTDGIAL